MTVAKKPQIILGESNKEINTKLTKILRQEGLEVFSAYNIEEFLQVLDQYGKNIDLACISGQLASDRGAMLVSRAKTMKGNIKIVIVVDEGEERADVLRYSADEFIQKPVTVEEIVTKIISLLSSTS